MRARTLLMKSRAADARGGGGLCRSGIVCRKKPSAQESSKEEKEKAARSGVNQNNTPEENRMH